MRSCLDGFQYELCLLDLCAPSEIVQAVPYFKGDTSFEPLASRKKLQHSHFRFCRIIRVTPIRPLDPASDELVAHSIIKTSQ